MNHPFAGGCFPLVLVSPVASRPPNVRRPVRLRQRHGFSKQILDDSGIYLYVLWVCLSHYLQQLGATRTSRTCLYLFFRPAAGT